MDNISEEILRACTKNNVQAQRLFFDQTKHYLHGVSIRYISDYHLREEVIQDAYVKIFSHLKSFDKRKSSLKTWITTITVRTCLNALRTKNIITSNLEGTPASSSSQNALPLENMKAEHILQVIEQLASPSREIFNLYEIEGYNHQEIAKMLNIPSATSRSYLSRAKKKLQKLLLEFTNLILLW